MIITGPGNALNAAAQWVATLGYIVKCLHRRTVTISIALRQMLDNQQRMQSFVRDSLRGAGPNLAPQSEESAAIACRTLDASPEHRCQPGEFCVACDRRLKP